jgi:hypothetical protein
MDNAILRSVVFVATARDRLADDAEYALARSKTEMSGLARRVRFTLRSRHRQPAPACPFGANERTRFAGARCARNRLRRWSDEVSGR